MGIDNIHFLSQDDTFECLNARKRMSQHIVIDGEKKFVFGWDQPLMSFYLQVHDLTRAEDDQIVVWWGATAYTRMYEVEDLVREANQHGLLLDHSMRVKLYAEKDDGV